MNHTSPHTVRPLRRERDGTPALHLVRHLQWHKPHEPLSQKSGPSLSLPAALGSLHYGAATEPRLRAPRITTTTATTTVATRVVLPQDVNAIDTWSTSTPPDCLHHGDLGPLRWVHDDSWLMGSLSFDATTDLIAATRQAYTTLFQVLDQTGFPHLLRLWNYLPHINDDHDQIERYQGFNIGRQQAFIQCGRSALDGAPAACALGIRQGTQGQVHFLAGQQAPLTIENPRQTSAFRYPCDYGPSSPTFSRAAVVTVNAKTSALFISGTASIVGHATVHAGDVVAQTLETVVNLQTIVREARRHSGADFDLSQLLTTVYVRHASDAQAVVHTLTQALTAEYPDAPQAPALRQLLVLEADICRQDLLVEIEAQGFASRLPPE